MKIAGIEIKGLSTDSRLIKPGYLFGAQDSEKAPASAYIPSAVQNGAAVIICKPEYVDEKTYPKVKFIAKENPNKAFAETAAEFYGPQPENIAAVTGTNGKTSIADFVRQILTMMNLKAASMGTLGLIKGREAPIPSPNTTPNAAVIAEELAGLKKEGYEIRYTDNLPELIGNLPDCGCLTSGACADQLFMHIIHRYDLSLYHLPWIEGAKRLFALRNLPLSGKSLEYFKAIWEDYAKIFDVEIRYFCDFVWLYNFAIRYGFVRDRESMMIAKLKNASKYQAFFDSFDFQCWSVGNVPNLNAYHQVLDRYHYKKELKDYTFSVVKDPICYELGKHVSRPYPYEKINEIVIYDSEGIKIFHVPTGDEYWRAGKYIGNLYRKIPIL